MANHLLLAGYFGCGNLGDDAILTGLTEGLGNENVELTLLSGSPEDTYRNYGIRSIPRKDLKVVQDSVEACDALVFPGGSVFQDVTSSRSTAYYHNLVMRAKKSKKKVIFLGQGVGPLRGFLGRRFAAASFGAADAIVVRDPQSAITIKELGVKRHVQVGADLAFLMPPPPTQESGEFQVGGMRTVGIAPRPFGRNVKQITRLFGDLARMLYKANIMPVLIEMDRHEDGPLIYEIGKLQGGKVPDIRRLHTPREVQQRMARMETVIAMRLHAGILAATVNVPPFMISYDPKVTAFAKLLGMHAAPPIEGLTAERLFESFMGFQRDRERNLKILAAKREEMVRLAQVNVDVLKSHLRSTVAI